MTAPKVKSCWCCRFFDPPRDGQAWGLCGRLFDEVFSLNTAEMSKGCCVFKRKPNTRAPVAVRDEAGESDA